MSVDRLRKRFATSQSLSQTGVWVKVDLGDGDKPIEFLLARMGRSNRKWASQATLAYRANKRKIDAGLMSDEESTERALKVFCRTVLLDWRHVTKADGSPIPYTPDEGIKLLTECDGLYDYLLEESQELSNFQDQAQQVAVGN